MEALRLERILVPTDFSETARAAQRYAGELARRFGASLTVLHVFLIPGYAIPEGFLVAGPQTLTELTAQLEQALDHARRELEEEGVARVDTRLEQGTPHQQIVRVASEGGYDLIVIGTHGRTGLTHALLGSVAERVVRRAPCPVLTIRAPRHAEAHPAP